nr:chromatin assembly factor 1 subunit FAS1 [Tanacetum cinerariifolium]
MAKNSESDGKSDTRPRFDRGIPELTGYADGGGESPDLEKRYGGGDNNTLGSPIPSLNTSPNSLCRADVSISLEEREARISVLRDDIVALNKYYNEKFSGNDELIKNVDLVKGNAVIACLLEESRLSLSKLVEMVFDKVKESDVSVTVASVKSSVLLIGQRSFYGVQDLNADVLEDDSPSCLWCWETRDVKLLPKAVRGIAPALMLVFAKQFAFFVQLLPFHDAAVLSPLSQLPLVAFSIVFSFQFHDVFPLFLPLLAAASALFPAIKSVVQKTNITLNCKSAEKEVKREEKIAVKQLEKNKREEEKVFNSYLALENFLFDVLHSIMTFMSIDVLQEFIQLRRCGSRVSTLFIL